MNLKYLHHDYRIGCTSLLSSAHKRSQTGEDGRTGWRERTDGEMDGVGDGDRGERERNRERERERQGDGGRVNE